MWIVLKDFILYYYILFIYIFLVVVMKKLLKNKSLLFQFKKLHIFIDFISCNSKTLINIIFI